MVSNSFCCVSCKLLKFLSKSRTVSDCLMYSCCCSSSCCRVS